MGRLQVARPAGTLAARCAPAATPATLGLPRAWHHSPSSRAASSPFLRNRARLTGSSTTVRYHATLPPNTPPTFQTQVEQDAGIAVSSTRSYVTLHTQERSPVRLDALWLRDACPCPRCVDPDSGQKNFSTTELSSYPIIDGASLLPDGSLEVVFANDRLTANKSHTSVFPADEVKSWLKDASGMRGEFRQAYPNIPWNKSMFEARLAQGGNRISYHDWMTNEAEFWRAFTDLCQTGLIFITDVPKDEKEVERIAQRVGPIQYTFYGWTWDVKSKPQAENVAYTSQFLGLHQDLMYHLPIPKLQLLHCLANSCEGGESLFSSGLRAAHELQLTDPHSYDILTQNTTNFLYQRNGHHYSWRHPTIVESIKGYPSTTYWAPPFQGPFRKRGADDKATLRQWKNAATAFQRIVEAPHNLYEYKLQEGECVVFDNRRVLHGRKEFATGQGERWLKGAYVAPQVYFAKETELADRVGTVPATPGNRAALAEHEVTLVRATLPEGAVVRPRAPPPAEKQPPRKLLASELRGRGPFAVRQVEDDCCEDHDAERH